MTSNTDSNAIPPGENPAETMRKVMEKLGQSEQLPAVKGADVFTRASMVTLPDGRTIHDLTAAAREAAEFLKPARRRGTAKLGDLQSLIRWTNRFKGGASVMFADPDMDAPTLTCIADYHYPGPPDCEVIGGEATARHCHHRAVYRFPVSNEWRAWNSISGDRLGKDGLGEFIEANAKDIMDPTTALIKGVESGKNEHWENRLIATARHIEGRYGQLSQLLAMSKRFQVYEKSDLTVSTNRDTGESEIQFLNEHKGADGKPLNIPNLIIIAIPVFQGGALYRMPVRFRYRKTGGEVAFILSIYNPEKAFDAAFDEALQEAGDETGLPVLIGTPEA